MRTSSLIKIESEHDGRNYFASIVETRKVIQFKNRFWAGWDMDIDEGTSRLLIVIEAAILRSRSPLAVMSSLLVLGYAGPSTRTRTSAGLPSPVAPHPSDFLTRANWRDGGFRLMVSKRRDRSGRPAHGNTGWRHPVTLKVTPIRCVMVTW